MKLYFSPFGFPQIRLEKDESIIIISDTHIGVSTRDTINCNLDQLYSFLKDLKENKLKGGEKIDSPSLLVLLGDVLDFWQGGIDTVLSDFYIIAKILLTLDSVKLYIAGNHDRIIGRLLLRDIEGKEDFIVTPEMAIVESGDKRFILIHGHQFDSLFAKLGGLWKLESYIYSLAEGFMSLPGKTEWYMAGLSALSGLLLLVYGEVLKGLPAFIKPFIYMAPPLLMLPLLIMTIRKVQDELWYLFLLPLSQSLNLYKTEYPHPQELIKRKSIVDWLKANKDIIGEVNGVIFGHTHIPGIAKSNGLTVANTGSWINEKRQKILNNTFIYLKNGKVRLYQYNNGDCKLLAEV